MGCAKEEAFAFSPIVQYRSGTHIRVLEGIVAERGIFLFKTEWRFYLNAYNTGLITRHQGYLRGLAADDGWNRIRGVVYVACCAGRSAHNSVSAGVLHVDAVGLEFEGKFVAKKTIWK